MTPMLPIMVRRREARFPICGGRCLPPQGGTPPSRREPTRAPRSRFCNKQPLICRGRARPAPEACRTARSRAAPHSLPRPPSPARKTQAPSRYPGRRLRPSIAGGGCCISNRSAAGAGGCLLPLLRRGERGRQGYQQIAPPGTAAGRVRADSLQRRHRAASVQKRSQGCPTRPPGREREKCTMVQAKGRAGAAGSHTAGRAAPRRLPVTAKRRRQTRAGPGAAGGPQQP